MTTNSTATDVTMLTCKNHGIQSSGRMFGGATLCEECIRDFFLGHGVQQLFNSTPRVEVKTEVGNE
jgi:hypothetical protein